MKSILAVRIACPRQHTGLFRWCTATFYPGVAHRHSARAHSGRSPCAAGAFYTQRAWRTEGRDVYLC